MKRILLGVLTAAVLLTGCVKKKEDEPSGPAHVRFSNMVYASFGQDVYINSVKVTSTKLEFGQQTAYYTYQSGLNSIDFADNGSLTSNALLNYGVNIGDYSTVFFYRDANSLLSVGAIKDDMSAPPAGKARVRFINLNYKITSSVKVLANGNELVPIVSFGYASAYYNVDPGTKFTPQAVSLTTAPEINFTLTAGKIYTILLNGPTPTELYAFGILQN